jgi:hypothetical protein
MLCDCASQGVLNGDYGSGDRSALQSVEYFDGASARHDPAASQHVFGGFVAEGTEFALDGNFHHRQGSWRRRESANPWDLSESA